MRYDDALTRLEEAAVRQKYGDAPAALQSVRASVLRTLTPTPTLTLTLPQPQPCPYP